MQKRSGNTSVPNMGLSKITTVVATAGYGSDAMTEISYTDTKVIGNGSFGVVFQAKMVGSNELVAIKKVLQDRRFKNRELQIMRRLKHVNIVLLKYFFYSSGDKREDVYLNLVLEYVPETLYKIERQFSRAKQILPVNYVRLYMYQLFRSLAYIHSYGICHRDIKPQNLLLDSESATLKLCDFGSAKQLIPNETNVSYICSRYYRAPELIFGSVNYTTKIDMWSAGCVLAELLLGQLIFPGDSGVDQIVEIVKVMGTPSAEQLHEMNPNYKNFKLPQLKPHPWPKVFRIRSQPEAIDLVSKLLVYTPNARISSLMACAHPFFDELRQDPNQTLPNGHPLPPLFNFTEHELGIEPNLVPLLLPKNTDRAARNQAGAEVVAAQQSSDVAAPQKSPIGKTPRAPQHQQQQQLRSATKSRPISPQKMQTCAQQQQQLQMPQQQQQQQYASQQLASTSTLGGGNVGAQRITAGAAGAPVQHIRPHILSVTLQDIGNGDGIDVPLAGTQCQAVTTTMQFDDVLNVPNQEHNVLQRNINDLDLEDDDPTEVATDNDDIDENEFHVNYSSDI